MNISHFIEEKILFIQITEELDHYAQEKLRRRVDYEIQRFMPKKLVFDFKKLEFMDSAGIGFLIGRYKKTKMYGGEVELINVNEKIKKILELSGVLKILNIVEEYNESFSKII